MTEDLQWIERKTVYRPGLELWRDHATGKHYEAYGPRSSHDELIAGQRREEWIEGTVVYTDELANDPNVGEVTMKSGQFPIAKYAYLVRTVTQ